ncbi:MAG: glycoside hydrolase family 2 TIM barrel-domain containing protein [Endomicrobiales bacterium]
MKIFLLSLLMMAAFPLYAQGRVIVEERGGERVRVVKYDSGEWELLVGSSPYFIKGVVFTPVAIGESPSESTMQDWMYYDLDGNGRNDIASDVWVDRNKNNRQDRNEPVVGDFRILKDMGCNTVRLYHVASDNPLLGEIYRNDDSIRRQYDHAVNKEVLRTLYSDYGIRVIMGSFAGSWTIGAGATWDEGCDYTNPAHRENIKRSVQAMVEDNRDEPYVLLWLLGNENNIATWSNCNAGKHYREYLQFMNELAQMVHSLDPSRPVALCEGYKPTALPLYKELLPDMDIIAFNAYLGKWGFGTLWKQVKRTYDRPVFISEYGIFSYNIKDGDNEDQQREYHQGCYKDFMKNRAGVVPAGAGNCIGGCIFDYLDRWYMDGTPETQNPGARHWPCSPDQLDHEEYFGVTSMGDGKDTLFKRQLKSAYFFYQEQWREK